MNFIQLAYGSINIKALIKKIDVGLVKKEIDKRLKEGVYFRALAGMSTAVLASQKKDKQENKETRILPKDVFDIKVALGVHGNKTVVVNNEKNFGFIVEDVDLADTIKQIFDVVWNSGRVMKN